MAMKGIPSAEKVPVPVMGTGEAPKHTKVGHEACAYYLGDEHQRGNCPHGMKAFGAFYSEDYVNSLRRLSHELLGELDKVYDKINDHPNLAHTPRFFIQNRDQYYDDERRLLGPIEPKYLGYTRSLIEDLRELTK